MWNWLPFFVGFAGGWLLEWIIDWIFWRRKGRVANDILGYQSELEDHIRRIEGELSQATQLHNETKAQLDACRSRQKEQDSNLASAQAELADLQSQLAAAQADLSACQAELGEANINLGDMSTRLANFSASNVVVPPPDPDDLTKIEGIGPKIQEVLNNNGIYTFAQLADSVVENIKSFLDAAGSRFAIAVPDTWGQQAALARDGLWEELQTLQDKLDGGRLTSDS
jgi:predicted flap endonuclease-1-like 5' DNA nuclease